MKKFLSVAMSAIIACASIFSCTLTAFAENAETEDVTIDCSSAETCSNWKQSITVDQATFNATRLTKDSEIIVTFKSEEINEKAGNKYNAELIFQSWDNTTTPAAQDGAVWAKIAPVKFDDSSATYDFESIATAYGTDDFSQVYNIIIGATDGAKIVGNIIASKAYPQSNAINDTIPTSSSTTKVVITVPVAQNSNIFSAHTRPIIQLPAKRPNMNNPNPPNESTNEASRAFIHPCSTT